MLKLVRCDEDDAITHGRLRLRISNLTKSNLTQPNLNSSPVMSVCTHLVFILWMKGYS
jgi:hypothetical protein